jgi:hypothetical protein
MYRSFLCAGVFVSNVSKKIALHQAKRPLHPKIKIEAHVITNS